MSEQATMTREQLEAVGYRFYEAIDDVYNRYAEVFFDTPDGYESPRYEGEPDSMAQLWEQATQAATAHYHRQQELFNFREFLHDIDGLLDKLAFYNSNHDALDDLQILRASINIPNTWHGDAGTWNPPTVSESERAE